MTENPRPLMVEDSFCSPSKCSKWPILFSYGIIEHNKCYFCQRWVVFFSFLCLPILSQHYGNKKFQESETRFRHFLLRRPRGHHQQYGARATSQSVYPHRGLCVYALPHGQCPFVCGRRILQYFGGRHVDVPPPFGPGRQQHQWRFYVPLLGLVARVLQRPKPLFFQHLGCDAVFGEQSCVAPTT